MPLTLSTPLLIILTMSMLVVSLKEEYIIDYGALMQAALLCTLRLL